MLRLARPAAGSRELGYVTAALLNDELVVVPTDTVYGIVAHALSETACRRLYEAKGRTAQQPTAVLFSNLDQLLDTVPGLSLRARAACEALLPGPYTLVVANPATALPWLCGAAPHQIGLRVPAGALELPPLAATSANPAGEREAQSVAELPASIADKVACAVDAGPLAGASSTVLDLVQWELGSGEPSVLRDPGERAANALAALAKI